MKENLKPNKNHQSVYAEDVGLEKSSYLKETLVQTSQKSKELWKTLKSLGLPSEERKRSKVLLNMAQFSLNHKKTQISLKSSKSY